MFFKAELRFNQFPVHVDLEFHLPGPPLLILLVEAVEERVEDVGDDSQDEPVYDDFIAYIQIPLSNRVIVCSHLGGIVMYVSTFEDTLDQTGETAVEDTSLELHKRIVVPGL